LIDLERNILKKTTSRRITQNTLQADSGEKLRLILESVSEAEKYPANQAKRYLPHRRIHSAQARRLGLSRAVQHQPFKKFSGTAAGFCNLYTR
jgi:hypothetical protein